jgi:hypothetical protein
MPRQTRDLSRGLRPEELREFWVRASPSIHYRDQFVPSIRSKLEAGAIGERALGALASCPIAGARHAINVDTLREIVRIAV